MQTAKTTCMESKKKNMNSKDNDAPTGRQTACDVLMVWNVAKI